MRIALHHTGEVGVRTGRILLGEPTLSQLGLVDRSPAGNDPRIVRATQLEAFDVVATDSDEPDTIVARAAQAGISAVLWTDGASFADDSGFPETTLLCGANLASGIAPALALHDEATLEDVQSLTITWTEPGKPLRRGVPVGFPDPVGVVWGRERASEGRTRLIAAPVPGDWAGATATAVASERTRAIGVADLAAHLEALALAAGAITVAEGHYPAGVVDTAPAAEEYLLAALRCGLDVAAFTSAG